MTSDWIRSDPISTILDRIRLDVTQIATTGFGPQSYPVARRHCWIMIPALQAQAVLIEARWPYLQLPPTRGLGMGSGIVHIPTWALTSAAPDCVTRYPRPRRAIPCAGRRVAARGIVAHASPLGLRFGCGARAESRGGQSPPSISCLRAGSQSPPLAPRVRGRD